MALRNIVIDDDSILRKKCREVTVFDQRLHQLLDDMAETMYQADGVGLAAPQVGVLKRVVVIDVGEGLVEPVSYTHLRCQYLYYASKFRGVGTAPSWQRNRN